MKPSSRNTKTPTGRSPHPTMPSIMSLVTLALGVMAIAETAYYAFIMFGDVASPNTIAGDAVMFTALVAAVIWQVMRPERGAYATIAVTALATAGLTPTPFTLSLLAIASLTTITVHRPAAGVICGAAYAILMMLDGHLNPVGSMGGGSAYTFSGFIAAAVAIGYCIRVTMQHDAEQRIHAEMRRNMRIARELHDHTTNDLSDIILLINRNTSENGRGDGHGDAATTQPANIITREDLTTIRTIAADALRHTRGVIRTLEQNVDSPHASSRCRTIHDDHRPSHRGTGHDGTDRGGTGHGESIPLDTLIPRYRRRLERLGYHGEVIVLGNPAMLRDEPRSLTEDLLRELFANIVKHADPNEEYTMMIAVTDRQCTIDMSDSPLPRPSYKSHDQERIAHIGMRSGLHRYREILNRMGGTLTVGSSGNGSPWTLHASIPIDADSPADPAVI